VPGDAHPFDSPAFLFGVFLYTMAEGKKSFVLYSDYKNVIDKLPDEKAGQLLKLIFDYVNDKNPQVENYDLLVQIAFEPIRLQLKRDLKKWEIYIDKQRDNGSKGGRPPKNPEVKKKTLKTQAFSEKPKKADTVTVTDNVTDNVNEKKHCKVLLSEINISDFDYLNEDHYKIAISFYELFKNNLAEKGFSTAQIEKANGKWIDDVRLMIETDKRTVDEFRIAFAFLKSNAFWKSNIRSTAKLREKFDTILLQSQRPESKKQTENDEYEKFKQDTFREFAEGIGAM